MDDAIYYPTKGRDVCMCALHAGKDSRMIHGPEVITTHQRGDGHQRKGKERSSWHFPTKPGFQNRTVIILQHLGQGDPAQPRGRRIWARMLASRICLPHIDQRILPFFNDVV